MKLYEYISIHAKAFCSLSRKYDKLREQLMNEDIASKRRNKLAVDLSYCGMHLGMEHERLGYVLGFLKIEDITKEWHPCGTQVVKGIADELKELKFDSNTINK